MPGLPGPTTSLRSVAGDAVEGILSSKGPAPPHLERAMAGLGGRDRALVHELTLGTVRWLRRLDDILERVANRPLRRVDHELLAPLRVGLYQLLFLDRVPAHAVVDEAVSDARRRAGPRATGFVNAVLRTVAGDPRLDRWPVEDPRPVRRLALETSHPDWLVERWVERFGLERAARSLVANNRPKPPQVLAFRHRGGPEALAETLSAEGIVTEPSSLSPLGLVVRSGRPLDSEAFRRGELYLQDEASQASALLPPPVAGERILDSAAAPGGKGLAMLAYEPAVRLVFADRSPARLWLLRRNLERLGLVRPVIAMDASHPSLAPGFDRVVLDLPCSGTGTLRKNPELKWRLSPSRIGSISLRARPLLAAAAGLLAVGGRLVIITCSLEREENEEAVAELLRRRRELRPDADWAGLPEGLAAGVEAPGLWRVHPEGDHDGFTVNVLVRASRRNSEG